MTDLLRAGPAVLAAGLLLGAGCATGSASEAVSVSAVAHPSRHALWQVQAAEGPAPGTVYLLGSLHVMRRADTYPLPRLFQSAFEAAEVVAFEVNRDTAHRKAAAMGPRGMLPPGRTLADVLPDSTGRLLRATLDSLGLSVARFRRMEPWLISAVLPAAALRGSGYSGEAGLDAHLFEKAKATGKKRIALETLDEQLAAFDGLPMRAQRRLLRATLRNVSRSKAQLDALTAAWSSGDTTALENLTARGVRGRPALRRRLLAARNRRWVPQIETLIARVDTSLVVVGVAHLVGEDSVVALLRQRGYTVQQL